MQTNTIKLKQALKAYTKPEIVSYAEQIKQACDFVNSRNEIFKGKYDPAVKLIIDYTESLENTIKEYESKFEQIKNLIEI